MVVKYPLKGVFKVTAKGRTYWYAWRGPPLGPRLSGAPGSPEFHASYIEAHQAHLAPDASRFGSLVVLYRASNDYKALAPSTLRNWSPWLDRVADYFGPLRLAQFDRPEKIRPVIRRWRDQWADKPRTADYAMQVLSRVLSHAVEHGKISGNPCEGIKQLYPGDRREIIWTDADIAALKKSGSADVAHAVDLAVYTGLRLGDLLRLSWSHIGEDAVTIATGKSKRSREAVIPLYDGLRDVLASIPKRSTTILTNRRNCPWKPDRIRNGFQPGKDRRRPQRSRPPFPRSSWHCGDEVLHRGPVGAGDRRDHGLGGESRRQDHKAIRRKIGRHQGNHPTAQPGRKGNISEKPTAKPKSLSIGAGEGNRTLVCSLGSCRSTIELRPQVIGPGQ